MGSKNRAICHISPFTSNATRAFNNGDPLSTSPSTIGFIGVGVMGEPMCRNLKRKSGADVIAFDHDAAPLQRLSQDGVATARSLREVVEAADVIFICLPSGDAVEAVLHG